MVIYADTSFLLSLYGQDANSGPAQAMASRFKMSIAFTPLLRHEARNAVRLAVLRNEITPVERNGIHGAIEADVQAGALVDAPLAWADVYAEAERLSAAQTEQLGTRASDILHVAAAVTLGVREFYTFDTRQSALAKMARLKVKP